LFLNFTPLVSGSFPLASELASTGGGGTAAANGPFSNIGPPNRKGSVFRPATDFPLFFNLRRRVLLPQHRQFASFALSSVIRLFGRRFLALSALRTARGPSPPKPTSFLPRRIDFKRGLYAVNVLDGAPMIVVPLHIDRRR